MMKKMYFKLLCTLFVAACSTLQAAEQHNGIIAVDNKISQPQCICFLSSNCIAIGGLNGVQLVDKKGEFCSDKFVDAGFQGSIYQIVRGNPIKNNPQNTTYNWYAVDQIEHHEIDTFANEITWNEQHKQGNWYFYLENNNLKPHAGRRVISNAFMAYVLLHPHYHNKTTPYDFTHKKWHSLTMNEHHILAVLTHDNNIEFWVHNVKNQSELLQTIPLDQTEKLDESTEMSQRLSFSFDNLLLAVALKNKCFIISLLSQSVYYQKQEEAVCRLLLLLNPIQH